MWLGLSIQDIRIRYKRTVLGPFWITASQTATFVCMGMLFSAVLKNDIHDYLPYLAMGMSIWGFLSGVAQEGPSIFVQYHRLVTQLKVPHLVHVLRVTMRHYLILLHNLVAVVLVLLGLGGKLTPDFLLLAAGLPLLFVIAASVGLIFAIVGARFRDLGPIIGMGMQFFFFMTPIMWRLEDLPDGRKWWVFINPAYHIVELVRAPFTGHAPDMLSVWVSLGTAALLAGTGYCLFRRLRHRVAYWL